MRQFDVCVNPNPTSADRFPYLLIVQADLLVGLATRVVVPLSRPEVFGNRPITRLMPIVEVEGQPVVAVVPELAGVQVRELGRAVANLDDRRADILAALDLLVTGS